MEEKGFFLSFFVVVYINVLLALPLYHMFLTEHNNATFYAQYKTPNKKYRGLLIPYKQCYPFNLAL